MDLLLAPHPCINSSAIFTSPPQRGPLVLPSRALRPKPPTSRRPISLVRGQLYDYSKRQGKPSVQGWVPRPSPDSYPVSQPQGAPGGQGLDSRVFVGYSIYKGKAALTVQPKPPGFTPTESGAYKVSREGSVLLQFAPAMGARVYNWSKKQVLSLTVDELGTLMGIGRNDSCEFYHDPFKGKSEEGKIRKILKVEPLPDGMGHLFHLSVQNRIDNVDESIHIPISRGELTVLNSAFNFIIPYLLGWNTFGDSIKPENLVKVNNSSRFGADAEWRR